MHDIFTRIIRLISEVQLLHTSAIIIYLNDINGTRVTVTNCVFANVVLRECEKPERKRRFRKRAMAEQSWSNLLFVCLFLMKLIIHNHFVYAIIIF